ncbi:conserved Plasmodium protein, unknown function [Plasmodium gallinaceum]|uniref:Uncharacterized protein n=1 Tax=Plasmodium gallinaceum TaxID=5849 RepID=A0A1J1GRG2_PLAGA|nr:conserved Plasmodium protein, unknown function [Plasmodium gallinaceum]CRG95097.1 conserved Plasmodium protein, unknown function [Plasmodium gallinaceum]
MDKFGKKEYICTPNKQIESINFIKKKEYSNLITTFKKGIEKFNKDILIKKEKKEILNMIPLICEQSCELKKIKNNIYHNEISDHNDLFKTPHKKESGFVENLNCIKNFSCKKRIRTPCNFEKTNIIHYEENAKNISVYSTPKRYKKRVNEKKDDIILTSKNKKKKSLYEELEYLHTPLREKNKYNFEKINKNIGEKWIMNESNMHDLPENIKNEYVSYLCSPLKRSERLIKTKINKMLNENVEILKQEKLENNNDVSNNNITDKNNCDINEIHCDFKPEEEEKCWDEFYTQSVDKIKPFTGITTELAVSVITELLKSKIKKIKIDNKEFLSPISENDTIMEIGHGNHPLAVQMFEKWGTVGRYIGVEFSGEASREALKCKKLKNLLLKRKVEFIKVLSMNYYKEDFLNGIVIESNISPANTQTNFIKLYTFKYIFAKSTLDYITCRMDNIGNSCNWEEDLQISPSVVEMFNSLSDSLHNCKNSKNNSYIIFIEPNNSSKFRDHILTIFKVIYTATFKYNSSAKYLRLFKIINYNKACGYMIEKRNEIYQNFEELRQEFLKLILKSSFTKNIDEVDWFLPTREPKKWVSNLPDDIEYLVKLDKNCL